MLARRRWTVLGMFACAVLAWCAGTQGAEPDAGEAGTGRVLEFPDDRTMGMLYAREEVEDDGTLWPQYEWTEIGEARGRVTIEAGMVARLDVSRGAAKDLSPLVRVPADALVAINFRKTEVAGEQLAHIAHLAGLEVLELDRARITDASAEHFAGLTSLREIRLSAFDVDREGFGVGDGTLKVLATLPELEKLDLRRTKVTDAGMEALAACTSLRNLEISGTEVTDAGMEPLSGLPKLEGLRLGVYREGAKITDEGLKTVGRMAALESLDLSGTQVTDAGLAHLAGLGRLKNLSLENTAVTEEGLAELIPLESLEKLRYYGRLTDVGAAHLGQMTGLVDLTARPEVTDAGVAELAKLKRLKELRVSDHVTDAGMELIGAMTDLRYLWISDCPITEGGLEAISDLPNLEWLRVYQRSGTGLRLGALSSLPKLEMLGIYVGHGSRNEEGESLVLSDIGKLRGLKNLQLSGAGYSNGDLRSLVGLLDLDALTVRDMAVDDAGAVYVGGLTSLTSLNIEDGVMTDAGLAQLSNLRNLKFLQVKGHFRGEGLAALARLHSLRDLYAYSPYITQEDLDRLAVDMPALGGANGGTGYDPTEGAIVSAKDSVRRTADAEERAKLDVLEGKSAPELFVVNWLNTEGASLSLEAFRGRVVLVDFWGTWCGPCRAAMPKLKALRERYVSAGFEVVGIHTTSGGDKMADYVAEESITWPVAVDVEKQTTRAWSVPHYPSYYLIDRKGTVRMAVPYRDDVERAVVSLLEEE